MQGRKQIDALLRYFRINFLLVRVSQKGRKDELMIIIPSKTNLLGRMR